MPDNIHHLPRAKPRLVRPAPPEVQRQADLDDWLANRRKPSAFRAFIADLRDNANILTFGLTLGICIGALGTVGFAMLWSGM